MNDFLSLFPDVRGAWRRGRAVFDPSRQALAGRQVAFARSPWQHQIESVLNPGAEDAREVIIVGRKLGYREEDILHFLVLRFAIGPYAPELFRRAIADGWRQTHTRIVGAAIPEAAKQQFPALARYETF